MKYGYGSVIVLSCFGVGRKAYRFDSGHGNHEKRKILFNVAKTCYTICFADNWKKITFQQDSNLKYSYKLCQNYYESNKGKKLEFMTWLPQFPDLLFPIELVREELHRRIRREYPKSERELFRCLTNAGEVLTSSVFFSKTVGKYTKNV